MAKKTTGLKNRNLCRATSGIAGRQSFAKVMAVISATLVLSAGAAGCEYYASKSSSQTSTIQETLTTRLEKLEQSKFVPPSQVSPLSVDIRTIPSETYQIGRDKASTYTGKTLDMGIVGAGGGVGGDGGGGGGDGGGGGGGG